jgi:diketogulonate reductase-like aldo/keto reductase
MIPSFKLNNGIEIPAQGLGCFLTNNEKDATRSVIDAVDVGYRKIDTAMIYMNEEGIGRGIRECGLPREEIFVSTKLWNTDHGYENTMRAFEASLKRLGLKYVDQYLIHWPGFDEESYLSTWKAFEVLYKEGRVRSIGVCNFQKHALSNLLLHAEIKPTVNQIEVHPMFQPNDLISYCRANDIQVEAWRPIVWGKLDDKPEIVAIAKKYTKSPVQIVLRWHFQRGICPLPKTIHKERMIENLSVFDFSLTEEEMLSINSLQTYVRTGESPDEYFGMDGWGD